MLGSIAFIVLTTTGVVAASPTPSASASPVPTASASPSPAASPVATATPFPEQPRPGEHDVMGLPPGYDDAIHVEGQPTPSPTPDPLLIPQGREDDDPLSPSHMESHGPPWDSSKAFPGNYYALPLSVEFAFRPCLTCRGVPAGRPFLQRPGEMSAWAGYAFQPFPGISAPFMAAGLDWTFYENGNDGTTHTRNLLAPTWRVGWNWTAVNVYGQFGVYLPGESRNRAGFHAGIGASSFPILVFSACAGEVIPSIYEVGYDWLPPDPTTHESRNRWVLKVGWGF